jgi:glyoxylase-like metal-dependent hydrolase (beta-lactamase superfamily II)
VPRKVADGVYRLGTEWVGWYLVTSEDGGVAIVDCGFPGYHDQLHEALAEIGRPLDAVQGVVLTHYHSDHVGSADRIREKTGATIYAPAGDAEGLRTGKVPAAGGVAANIWRPRMARFVAHAVRNGGASHAKLAEFETYDGGDVLPVPGELRAIHTPGHTAGHCSLVSDERGVLFTGDAMSNVHLATGETGPRVHPFNEDQDRARESIASLEGLDATAVVFGHGEPFAGTPAEAVAAARSR